MKMKIALTLEGKVGYGKITQKSYCPLHNPILLIVGLRCNDKGCKIDI